MGAGDAADILARWPRARHAHAPELIVAELANAFALSVRAERRSLDDAQPLFGLFARSPIELHPTKPMAPHAIDVAGESELSAYDAFCAVLAVALAVPLMTADRRLAAAVSGSVLVA